MVEQFIGQFRLEEVLGTGHHGQVIRAVDTQLDRIVALKLLDQKQHSGFDGKSDLKEAKALAKLVHPNIVGLFGLVEHEERPVLVMEYVGGITLSASLQNELMPIHKAIPFMIQLTDALQTAHQKNLVHGDIKPANIMIDHNGQPKLLDFGLAKFVDRSDTLKTISALDEKLPALEGTIPYMSPEHIMGHQANKQTDIFSLGAVFYELLCGTRAFAANSQGAVINFLLNNEPESLCQRDPSIPNSLSQLVDKMLEKDPQKRFASMNEVATALVQDDSDSPSAWQSKPSFSFWANRNKFNSITLSRYLLIPVLAILGIWIATLIWPYSTPLVSTQIDRGIDRVMNFDQNGAVEEAQMVFSAILKDNAEHPAATAGLALSLLRQYSSQETDPATLRRATVLAESALASDPQLALANIAAAWAAEFNGNFKQALALYDISDTLDPDNVLSTEGRARTYLEQGEYTKAEDTLRQGIKSHPGYRIFYDDLGSNLMRRSRFKEAENVFEAGLSKHPDNVLGYANLAQALHMQGETAKAIQIIQDGLKVRKDASLYNNLGTYLFFQGQYAQSVSAFERTLEYEGNAHNFIYWANLGDAYQMMTSKNEDAKSAYRRATQLISERLQQTPENEGLKSRLALYASKAGDRKLSKKVLASIVTMPVNETVTYFRAAISYEIIGERKQSLIMLEQALKRGYPLGEISNEPALSKVREDKRYHLLLARQGEKDVEGKDKTRIAI